MHAKLRGRWGQAPRQVARNSIERTFYNARKRCNSNDLNSMFEIVAGELRAKLGMPQPCRKRGLNTTPVRWGMAAGPVGGGGAWPGFEATRRATSATWRHWCGGHRRDPWAWLRCPWAAAEPGQASHSDLAPQVWRAPEGSAAVPVGGGGAWPGFEATRRAKLAARTARGRAAAHRHTQRPGPPAPVTPVGP